MTILIGIIVSVVIASMLTTVFNFANAENKTVGGAIGFIFACGFLMLIAVAMGQSSDKQGTKNAEDKAIVEPAKPAIPASPPTKANEQVMQAKTAKEQQQDKEISDLLAGFMRFAWFVVALSIAVFFLIKILQFIARH